MDKYYISKKFQTIYMRLIWIENDLKNIYNGTETNEEKEWLYDNLITDIDALVYNIDAFHDSVKT